MSVIDTLVTDRAQTDVAAVKRLNDIDMSDWTAEESAAYLAGMKGAYNASDLNRVGDACEYLYGIISAMGYAVPNYTTPKTDWEVYDVPTAVQMQAYITNIAALKSLWGALQNIPSTMENLGYEGANNIEKLLIEIERQIERISAIFIYSNAWNAYSGTGFYIKE